MKKQNKVKSIKPLDSKFFADLANKIYNPKTRKFLNLCSGSLTNGPDPENPKRKMHCGLGELYFEMTGEHTGNLKEDDVVQIAMDNLSIKLKLEQDKKKIKDLIGSLKDIDPSLKFLAKDAIECELEDMPYSEKEQKVYDILYSIPSTNDDMVDESCNIETEVFKERSKLVANDFRDIAKILAVKSKKK